MILSVAVSRREESQLSGPHATGANTRKALGHECGAGVPLAGEPFSVGSAGVYTRPSQYYSVTVMFARISLAHPGSHS
jgi:hypothetical protein